MGVKAEFAFDVCWEVYRGAREILDTKRGVSALDVVDAAKFLWRPDIRPRLSEYVADFALAGQAALRGPEWASRLILFRVHYLALAPYEQARHFLGLSEWSWSKWTEQIRQRCGKECLRRALFPPRRYFQESSWELRGSRRDVNGFLSDRTKCRRFKSPRDSGREAGRPRHR